MKKVREHSKLSQSIFNSRDATRRHFQRRTFCALNMQVIEREKMCKLLRAAYETKKNVRHCG